ncbi:MAG TPA: zf-HC2 domain-containing protein [Halothiobacillus sp.]|nr:zf-HC2 domain-containing protein [Halothiobacillus sp.]
MLKCRAATRLLSEELERKLSFREVLGLRFHTLECTNCRNFGRQIKTLRQLSQSYAQGASVPDQPQDSASANQADDRN